MTQTGETTAPSEPEPKEEEIQKTPKKIRLALFFDGTLNNRFNIEAREEQSEAYKKYGKPGNSFENGRTNVAIMEQQVIDKASAYSDYDFVAKEYIPGQGTYNLKGDSLWGYSMAAGKSGVPGRAKLGVIQSVGMVSKYLDFLKDEHYIEKLSSAR